MQNYIQAYSIGEAWLQALKFVLKKGKIVEDDKGTIIDIVPLFIEINNPSITDKVIDKYGNKGDLDFLQKNFTDLSEIEEWGYSYAQRLYDYNGINQINEVIYKLTNNLTSKSATISLLKREDDKKHKPCLTTLDFKIRDEKLIIHAFFRSQDVGNKMYGDAHEIVKLGRVINEKLKIENINLLLSICSAHIYSVDLDKIRTIIDTGT